MVRICYSSSLTCLAFVATWLRLLLFAVLCHLLLWGHKGAPQAQCARSATIWASGRTRDPYFEILAAPRGIMVTPSVDFDF